MTRSLSQLAAQVVSGEAGAIRAAGRLISLLDDEPHRLGELLSHPAARTIQSRHLLGITGPPGSGKSTLVDAVVAEYRRRFPARRIGVLAVDPSSPFTGGAVLGDRVRMMRHAEDPKVFIRSMASRGRLGGLSLGVRGAIRVMGMLGCDPILIETVGVGQSEVEITRVADQVLVVLAPGQGDAIQLLKAGLLEIGDHFIVNKADRPDAQAFYAELLSAVRLGKSAGGSPGNDSILFRRRDAKVSLVSALDHQGIVELIDQVEAAIDQRTEHRDRRHEEDLRQEICEAIFQSLRHRLMQSPSADKLLEQCAEQVIDGRAMVDEAIDRLLESIPHQKVNDHE